MPYIDSNILIPELRKRANWARHILLQQAHGDVSTLRRLEENKQSPRPETLRKLAGSMPGPKTTLTIPYLENQYMDVYELCDELTHALDTDNRLRAEAAYEHIKSLDGFDTPINRQFSLCQQARLLLLRGSPSKTILPLIHKGLELSGTTEADFIGKALILYEPELLHTLAQVYAKDGNLPAAINILDNIQAGIIQFPSDDRAKGRLRVAALLTLAKCRLQAGDYKDALNICDVGFDLEVAHASGRYCPDFIYIKAQTTIAMGRPDAARYLLLKAYAGYMALHKVKNAQEVLATANKHLKTPLNVYGIDKLKRDPTAKTWYARGPAVQFTGLGNMLSRFREEAGIRRDDLCLGLCHVSLLSRLEADEIKEPTVYLIEALMQRMGRDINLYHTFDVPNKVFKQLQKRDRLLFLRRTHRYTQAAKLAAELETYDNFKEGINLQLILSTKAMIYWAKNKDAPLYLDMLTEAIKITRPNFDERDINRYLLTWEEAVIINQMAIYFDYTGDSPRAVRIYDNLLNNIETKWVDETLRATMYATVSFNYTNVLGPLKQREAALEVIRKAEAFERGRDRLIQLPDLIFNQAYNMLKLGKKDESLPLFAISFYVSAMFENDGQAEDARITKDFVKEEFHIDFDHQ